MLSLFRTNQLFFNVLLVPYAVILHLYVFLVQKIPEETSRWGIFSDWIQNRLPQQGYWPVLLVIVLVVIEGIMLNSLVIKHRLGRDISLFPGLLFVLLTSAVPEFLYLSPLHFANFFFILALRELMATYKNSRCADRIFNIGFFVAIAGMFFLPYVIFALLGIMGLNTLRAFKVKEFLMVLIGLAVPYFLLFIYYFWMGDTKTYFDSFAGQFGLVDLSIDLNWQIYFRIVLVSLVILTVFFSYGRYMFKRTIQIYKKTNILYWCIILGLLTIAITPEFKFDHLLILMAPLSILIANNFQMLRPRFAEAAHLIIVALIFVLQYFHANSGF